MINPFTLVRWAEHSASGKCQGVLQDYSHSELLMGFLPKFAHVTVDEIWLLVTFGQEASVSLGTSLLSLLSTIGSF